MKIVRFKVVLLITSFIFISRPSDEIASADVSSVYYSGQKNNYASYWKDLQIELFDGGDFRISLPILF